MFVSEQLRKENIAEYLLYMWQVEDSLRAVNLDTERLKKSFIDNSGRSEADCLSWGRWYDNLADMMRQEEKKEKGHLQINENVLIMLADLHARLLESDKTLDYRDIYYKALPYIVEFRAKNPGHDNDELRDCFDMLYGVWMLKLQQKTLTEATAKAVAVVSKMIGMLAAYYKEDKAGTLELE